jgi:hypothetical protein
MVNDATSSKNPQLEINITITSQEKIAANQRNAQLSTGPTSTEEQKTSLQNAAKHPLLARDVVVTGGDNEEAQAGFNDLLMEMRSACSPVE